MSIKDFFASEFETSDNHRKSAMQTHYYRATYEQTKDAILSLIQDLKGSNLIVSDRYQEISFQTSRYICVFSIVNMRPTESAVDIKISYNMISFGKGYKLIENMFDKLNKRLKLKGTGLFK